MATFYKAVHPDGHSFYDPAFRWLPEGWQSSDPIPEDWVVRHPETGQRPGENAWLGIPPTDARWYLSVSTEPADCVGFEWPCVLLEVEQVEPVYLDGGFPNKRRGKAFRIIRELPAHKAFGPNGERVVAIIERANCVTLDEYRRMQLALSIAPTLCPFPELMFDMAYKQVKQANRDAAWFTAQESIGWGGGSRAAVGELMRDLIPENHYQALTWAWNCVIVGEQPNEKAKR